MKPNFSYFMKAIPPEMYARTKATICRHIAIFEPQEFKVGEVLCVDDYHFVLFLANAPVTRVGSIEYRVKKGDMLAIQPWEEVYGVPSETEQYGRYLTISVKKEFFKKVSTEVAGGEVFQFQHIQNQFSNELLDLIGKLQLELMNYAEAYPQMIQSLCTQIVFQLLRDLNAEPKEKGRVGKDNQYIREAIQFMQQYYAANLSINDICNLIYLSPCHFKRLFKECTGMTPYRYLLDIRLGKAKELLRSTDHSIEDVAKQCGFVNAGHFAVAFKRATNLSPSEFRKAHLS